MRAQMLAAAEASPNVAGRFVYEHKGREEVRVGVALMAALVRWPYTTHAREIGALLSYAMQQSAGDTLVLPNEMRVAAPPAAQTEAQTQEKGSDRRREREPNVDEVRDALARAKGNVGEAAVLLGVSRQAVYRSKKKYGISDP